MYQIRCDDYILYDHRDDELVVLNPKCKLKVNAVGEGSFTILSTHPYFGNLKKLKSVFEIRQDGEPIFRGRMTADSRDMRNRLDVDLEGMLAVTNDSIVPPFRFPEDFPEAANATNVVEYFLGWLLDQHNGQVTGEWQKLKLGNVTVTDPNNYITRSSTNYSHTWDVLKSKLFDSSLGGYLCIRYEDDGNYVDYLSAFNLTNTQHITLDGNLLDLKNDTDATDTYSAILPIGKDGLTLESLADGNLTDDLVKAGKFIYSRSAVESYGWKCVPVEEATWDDVTEADNLKTNGMNHLTGTAMLLSNTITAKAVDLHFTDEQIQSFRIYRNVLVDLPTHGIVDASFRLMELGIDIKNPQNTTITVGDTVRTLVDVNNQTQSDTITRIEIAEKDIEENRSDVSHVKNQVITQHTQIINDCEQIILSALESYVETSDYEEFKRTVESEFEVMADRISMNFTETTERITDVDGDLQSVREELSKHFEFDIDGLTIHAGAGSMNLILDNDMIRFVKNGRQFGWWDGVDFHTGNIVVTVDERAQFGNFAFIPRSDGSLAFLKVSDYRAPVITQHPQSVTTGTYQSVTLQVSAAGSELKYQWQYSTDGTSWANMDGKTSTSISVTFPTTSTRYYRCIVTDGMGKSVITDVATVKAVKS